MLPNLSGGRLRQSGNLLLLFHNGSMKLVQRLLLPLQFSLFILNGLFLGYIVLHHLPIIGCDADRIIGLIERGGKASLLQKNGKKIVLGIFIHVLDAGFHILILLLLHPLCFLQLRLCLFDLLFLLFNLQVQVLNLFSNGCVLIVQVLQISLHAGLCLLQLLLLVLRCINLLLGFINLILSSVNLVLGLINLILGSVNLVRACGIRNKPKANHQGKSQHSIYDFP